VLAVIIIRQEVLQYVVSVGVYVCVFVSSLTCVEAVYHDCGGWR